MRFRLTEDQRALRAGMRELTGRRFGSRELRSAADATTGGGALRLDRGLWRDLGAAGFFALRLPDADGGAGLGPVEAVLVFEEAGRALLPGPLIATHLAAGEVPGAAEGEAVVAAVDPSGLVEWLADADTVCGDATGAVPLRSADPLTPLHRVPGAARAAQASVAAGAVGASGEAGASGEGGEVRLPAPDPLAVLLTAAEQLGTADRCGELAVQHARAREQFGQPIGAFQAVKHLCADMLVRTEVARAAVYAAALTTDPADIAAARLLADEAAVQGARDCLQVHGGMGFTWESEVHLHLKRAWVRSRRAWGTTECEETLAAALLA